MVPNGESRLKEKKRAVLVVGWSGSVEEDERSRDLVVAAEAGEYTSHSSLVVEVVCAWRIVELR